MTSENVQPGYFKEQGRDTCSPLEPTTLWHGTQIKICLPGFAMWHQEDKGIIGELENLVKQIDPTAMIQSKLGAKPQGETLTWYINYQKPYETQIYIAIDEYLKTRKSKIFYSIKIDDIATSIRKSLRPSDSK